MKNSYKLLIFDEQYSIVSDESHAQIMKAASMVDALMNEISSKVSHVDEKRIAVLVALQMASKVLALETQMEQVSERHKELADRVSSDIAYIQS